MCVKCLYYRPCPPSQVVEVPVEDVDDHEDRGQKVEKLHPFLHETGAVAHVDKADNHNKVRKMKVEQS